MTSGLTMKKKCTNGTCKKYIMKNLKKEASILKAQIVNKFGSIKNFANKINVDKLELLKRLSIDLSKENVKEVKKLIDSTQNINEKKRITSELIEVLKVNILEHPDSKNEKNRISFREFFSKNTTWTNTYFSEVINGKREFVTTKIELLCVKLEIEINKYI